MQYSKLDAGLASALSGADAMQDDEFVVSVRVIHELSPGEQEEFKELGGIGVDSSLPVLSAKVTRAGLDELTQKPWVQRVSLSRRLNPSQ